jgi:hypothetical protein
MTAEDNDRFPSLDPMPPVSGIPLPMLGESLRVLISALIAYVDNDQFDDAKVAVSYIKTIGVEASLQLDLSYAQATGGVQ